MDSKQIPTREQNPNGFHSRFVIKKIVGWEKAIDKTFFGDFEYDRPILRDPDENAEYFVMRLDTGGSDINHIKACRIGIHAYADAIEATIPELAKDLRERYPLL